MGIYLAVKLKLLPREIYLMGDQRYYANGQIHKAIGISINNTNMMINLIIRLIVNCEVLGRVDRGKGRKGGQQNTLWGFSETRMPNLNILQLLSYYHCKESIV
jgi:hypothetical protein